MPPRRLSAVSSRSGLLLVTLLAVACAGCGGAPRPDATAGDRATPSDTSARPAAESQAPLATASSGEREPDPSLETSLAPVHDVEVPARAEGLLMALDVEEGMRVRAEQPLARIDDRESRALLDEREALLARAESAWQRAQRLHEQKLIAEEEFIAARSDWQVARAQRDRARLAWEWCTVRAPFVGVVAERRTQVGRTVKEGEVLFRVSDPDLLRAELLLPQDRFGSVRAGQRVRLVPVAGGSPVAASITRVTPLVDPSSGAFRVTVDLDNRRARLPAGITVRVELEPR